MAKQPCVYILSNKPRGTLYVGATSNLVKRVWEHKNKVVEGFTNKYELNLLVYYEMYGSLPDAFEREKQLKRWKRIWKIRLIENSNHAWRDLFKEII